MDGDNNVPEDMEPEQLLFGLVRGEIIYVPPPDENQDGGIDRKSTRLNSSHSGESRMPSSA